MGLISRPDRFLLVAGLLFGLGLALVTPPFQAPDEPAHFYRAYRLSEGRLDLIPPKSTGVDLPASVVEITGLRGDLPFHPERKIAPETILAAFRIPLEPDRREPAWFPNTLQYPFVPYVPQALGIALGRLFGAPPLVLLYLARLANLIAGTLMVVFAVRRLPAFQWLAVMVALTPMALFLRASASAAVTAAGAAFLLVGAVARLAWGEGPARRNGLVLLAASTAALCASKAAYFPLAFLAFLIPAARFPQGRRARFLLVHTVLALTITAYAIAVSRTAGTIRVDTPGVDASRQIRDSLADPLGFLAVVATDYATHAHRYAGQLVGKLGWLDTKLPAPLILAYLAMLCGLLFVDANPGIEVRPWQRVFITAVILTTLVLISASQYAVWTPYGAKYIEGLQGRYFSPLVPAAAWALHGRRWAGRIPPRSLGIGLAAFSVLSFGISMWALVGRYYLLNQQHRAPHHDGDPVADRPPTERGVVAVHLVGGEDHEVRPVLLGIAHDGFRPLAVEDVVPHPEAILLKPLLHGEEPGRGPGLQAAVEVRHLVKFDVLDRLDDVEKRYVALLAVPTSRDLDRAIQGCFVLIGKINRSQDLSKHKSSPLHSLRQILYPQLLTSVILM